MNKKKKLIVIGAIIVVFLCVIIGLLSPSSEKEASVRTPKPTNTAVVETVEPKPTPHPTPPPTPPPTKTPTISPTKVPTEIPIKTPTFVEDVAAEYFLELVPGSLVISEVMVDVGELFSNPQLGNDAWYDSVTYQMGLLLLTAKGLVEVSVPENCDACVEMHNEMQTIFGHADEATLDWISWMGDTDEISYLDSMGVHIAEIGIAFVNATAIAER